MTESPSTSPSLHKQSALTEISDRPLAVVLNVTEGSTNAVTAQDPPQPQDTGVDLGVGGSSSMIRKGHEEEGVQSNDGKGVNDGRVLDQGNVLTSVEVQKWDNEKLYQSLKVILEEKRRREEEWKKKILYEAAVHRMQKFAGSSNNNNIQNNQGNTGTGSSAVAQSFSITGNKLPFESVNSQNSNAGTSFSQTSNVLDSWAYLNRIGERSQPIQSQQIQVQNNVEASSTPINPSSISDNKLQQSMDISPVPLSVLAAKTTNIGGLNRDNTSIPITSEGNPKLSGTESLANHQLQNNTFLDIATASTQNGVSKSNTKGQSVGTNDLSTDMFRALDGGAQPTSGTASFLTPPMPGSALLGGAYLSSLGVQDRQNKASVTSKKIDPSLLIQKPGGGKPRRKPLAPGLTASNRLRQFVDHSYRDFCLEEPSHHEANLDMFYDTKASEDGDVRKPIESLQRLPFPLKFHLGLTAVEDNGLTHIISWQPHGRSILIHKPKLFEEQVMERFFSMKKLTSFQRQLNLYGFRRITCGVDAGSYYHELFLRGKAFLCRRMQRIKIKGNGFKAAARPETEPEFYKMLPCRDPMRPSEHLLNQPTIKQENKAEQIMVQPVNGQKGRQDSAAAAAALLSFSSTQHQEKENEEENKAKEDEVMNLSVSEVINSVENLSKENEAKGINEVNASTCTV